MSYSHNGTLYHGTRLDSKYEPTQKTNTVSEVNEVSETIMQINALKTTVIQIHKT